MVTVMKIEIIAKAMAVEVGMGGISKQDDT